MLKMRSAHFCFVHVWPCSADVCRIMNLIKLLTVIKNPESKEIVPTAHRNGFLNSAHHIFHLTHGHGRRLLLGQ